MVDIEPAMLPSIWPKCVNCMRIIVQADLQTCTPCRKLTFGPGLDLTISDLVQISHNILPDRPEVIFLT